MNIQERIQHAKDMIEYCRENGYADGEITWQGRLAMIEAELAQKCAALVEVAVTQHGDNDVIIVHVSGDSDKANDDVLHEIIMWFYDGFLLHKHAGAGRSTAQWHVDGRRGERKAANIHSAYAS